MVIKIINFINNTISNNFLSRANSVAGGKASPIHSHRRTHTLSFFSQNPFTRQHIHTHNTFPWTCVCVCVWVKNSLFCDGAAARLHLHRNVGNVIDLATPLVCLILFYIHPHYRWIDYKIYISSPSPPILFYVFMHV